MVLLLGACGARAAEGLVIHEWGTLTSLEDENGRALAGINYDDEPVPAFVHQVAPGLLVPGDAQAGLAKGAPASHSDVISNPFRASPEAVRAKGLPPVHPDVTVRLETPVLYIHAPAGFVGPLDISVKYPGGWLTEFYPDAKADAPGIDPKTNTIGHITPNTVGTLEWTGLKIGGDAPGPKTDARVWLAPRNVAADGVTTPSGESEKFLFYRGVGCGEPILNIVRDPGTNTLKALPGNGLDTPLPWVLADIRADGAIAFQSVAANQSSHPFAPADYSTSNIVGLRANLEDQLTGAGLNKDEAEALLNTWQVSYFQNPGLRAFYLWPRPLVDRLLPLTVSHTAEITRVMVGRIELVTPEQRTIMARISSADPETPALYNDLGRFRAAMLLDQERAHWTAALSKFMQNMSVAYYRPQ